ncbi:hypothetical protein [Escherichia coli]|uniref:phage tail tip protein n=1 Tax=Escherichia coli TaxID=562 RepID=UPI00373AE3DA
MRTPGTLNNVTIKRTVGFWENWSANQIEGSLVKTVGKSFPPGFPCPERWPSGNHYRQGL